jgi:hypothetical protein
MDVKQFCRMTENPVSFKKLVLDGQRLIETKEDYERLRDQIGRIEAATVLYWRAEDFINIFDMNDDLEISFNLRLQTMDTSTGRNNYTMKNVIFSTEFLLSQIRVKKTPYKDVESNTQEQARRKRVAIWYGLDDTALM